jgi:hypothetical protein
VRQALRDLGADLLLLNYSVSAHLDLRATDLECLDLITRYGPLIPSSLARRAGLHPATMTGILDRLERGGWIERNRDPADRRSVPAPPRIPPPPAAPLPKGSTKLDSEDESGLVLGAICGSGPPHTSEPSARCCADGQSSGGAREVVMMHWPAA